MLNHGRVLELLTWRDRVLIMRWMKIYQQMLYRGGAVVFCASNCTILCSIILNILELCVLYGRCSRLRVRLCRSWVSEWGHWCGEWYIIRDRNGCYRVRMYNIRNSDNFSCYLLRFLLSVRYCIYYILKFVLWCNNFNDIVLYITDCLRVKDTSSGTFVSE